MKENAQIKNGFDTQQHHVNYKKYSFYTPEDIIEKESQDIILSNMLLTWAGCYVKAYEHYIHNRLLQDYVLIYCLDGQGWLELQDNRFSIKKGDLLICPPGIIHSYGADAKDPWTKYWVHFRGDAAPAYVAFVGATASAPIVHIGENIKLLSLFQEIMEVLKTGYTHSNLLLATSYLNTILSYINNLEMKNALNSAGGINIDQIINYMLDNLNTNLDLEQLAHYANLSKYHFTKLFKEKTGYTPIDYYIRLKIQKACELLTLSNVTIVSLSSSLGFNNPYYFSIAFKKIIGSSPQNYRNQHKNQPN